MIITVEDIRRYREIAANTQRNRVEIFIRETEELDIIPLLGVDEYRRLSEYSSAGFLLGSSVLGYNSLGGGAVGPLLTPEEQMLLDGGQYVDSCGCMRRFAGLKAAEAYLTFARFIRTHPLQVTPYGVVVKEGDDSMPASAQGIAAVSKDSEKIGRQYLADAVRYWREVSGAKCAACQPPVTASRRKFVAIGD